MSSANSRTASNGGKQSASAGGGTIAPAGAAAEVASGEQPSPSAVAKTHAPVHRASPAEAQSAARAAAKRSTGTKAKSDADADYKRGLTPDEEDARRIVRAEMQRRGITYKMLAKLLSREGERTTPQALISRITGGAFAFSFAIRVLRILGVSQVDIRPLKDR